MAGFQCQKPRTFQVRGMWKISSSGATIPSYGFVEAGFFAVGAALCGCIHFLP